MNKYPVFLIFVLLASLFLTACSGASPTPPPITPVEGVEAIILTPIPPLNIDALSEDTRECSVPIPGYSQYLSTEDGFCFLFPTNFELNLPEERGLISLIGPEHPLAAEPLRATLNVQVKAAELKTIEQVIDEVFESNPGANIVTTSISIGGKPAEILEQVPGEVTSRQAIILANQRIFTFTLTPSQEEFPSAFEDANQVWTSALETLHFFTPESTSSATDGLDTSGWAVTEFTGFGMRILLPPEWEAVSLADAFALAPRDNTVQDWIILRTHPELLATEPATLTKALSEQFLEQGVAYNNFLAKDFNGIPAVSVMGEVGLCQDIYVPAYDLVHQIAVNPILCSESGAINGCSNAVNSRFNRLL